MCKGNVVPTRHIVHSRVFYVLEYLTNVDELSNDFPHCKLLGKSNFHLYHIGTALSSHETQTAVNVFCKTEDVYGAKMANFT
jgi:hypothetical protein